MSTSPADPDRQRLFSPATIVAFGAVITLALVLAFPREKLETRLLNGAEDDNLTVAYLEAWLRADPSNADVLEELTNAYLKREDIGHAGRTLARLERSSDPAARRAALAIRLASAQQRVYALKPGDPARAARIREDEALLLDATRYPWANEQLIALAQQARALNDGEAATRFYAKLVTSDPGHANHWRVEIAEVETAAGHYQAAADAWFAAQADAPTQGERRAMFFAGLRALQAGNLLAQALAAAQQHIGDLGDDPETLRFLVHLAMAAGRPDQAEGYAKRLLKMSRRNEEREDVGAPRLMLASYRAGGPVATGGIRYASYTEQDARDDARASPRGGHWLRIALPVAPPVSAAAASPAAAGSAPLAGPVPADTSDEDLAFGVFLANGDVASAERVAQRALDKAPQSATWRRRLAQVAEWNHEPQVALTQWLALAQSSGDENAWAQVARLAPGLNDDRALLATLLHQSERAPADLKLVDQVVAGYERLADPSSAMRFLTGRAQGAQRRPILERIAQLAERMGNDDLALQTWRTLEHDYGPDAAYAQKVATLLYARTDFPGALAALREGQRAMSPADDDYRRFAAEIAVILQRNDVANAEYRALLGSGHVTPDDLNAMMTFYEDSPIDAGRLAELAFRETGQTTMLQRAMQYDEQAHAWGRIAAMLAALTPAQRASAEQSAAFLLARSAYRTATGDANGAASDIRAALAIDPNNPDAVNASLWDLIEHGTQADLSRALHRHADEAENDSTLWGAYAAAYQRLGDGRQALHYLHKQAATSMNDPLWRLAWADALELDGRTGDAWRVRREVWNAMARRRASAGGATGLPAAVGDTDPEDLQARRVALAQMFANADVSRAMLIELLREDRQADAGAGEPAQARSALGDLPIFDKLPPAQQQTLTHERTLYSAIAREAAISWAQSQGETELEHAWLVSQYAKRSARPVYAEAQLAIDEGDVNTLDRLLETQADMIPRQNRVEAWAMTGRHAAAQSDAFASLTRQPNDETMQAQFDEQALRTAQSVGPAVRYVNQGPLRYTESSVTGGVRIGDTQSLQLHAMQRDQSNNATSLPDVPVTDRLFEATWRHQGQFDDERVTIGRRDAFEDFTTARAQGQYAWSPALTLTWALGYNQAATESTQLQVAGTKDIASVGFNYRLDPHWFAGARDEYARFHGQDRSLLGSGNLVEFNAGYKIKADYPDFTIGLQAAHGQYSASGAPGAALRPLLPAGAAFDAAAFMPQTFTQVAVLFSFGEDLVDGYTKAWRPMISVGPVYDSRAKLTAQITVGIAGSVFGGDQALIYGAYSGASTATSTAVKEIGAQYRWLY